MPSAISAAMPWPLGGISWITESPNFCDTVPTQSAWCAARSCSLITPPQARECSTIFLASAPR
jgi:hypothetical protein